MSANYSQLRAMMAVARASFRSITRSPSAVIFTLVFPLIFILVFGFLGSRNIHLNVALTPTCDKQNQVYELMIQNQALSIQHDLTKEEQEKFLLKGKIDAIIDIKKIQREESTPTLDVTMYTTMASPEKGAIVKSIMQHLIDRFDLKAAHITTPVAEFNQKELPGRAYSTIDFILPGQLGFALLSSGVFGTAFVFFNLRQTLVIKRFFATPIRKPYIVMGEALSRLVFSLLGAAFLIILGHLAFGFTLIHGIFTFMMLLGLSAIGLIVFMGLGFVVSGIAKSESTIPPLANIFTLPQFLLAGTFFSIDNFPTWIQPICKALPLTYLNDAMRKVAFDGAGIVEIAPSLGIVLLWGVIIYIAAVRLFKWE